MLADDQLPRATLAGQPFYEDGPNAGKAPAGSSKVGWTLRRGGAVVAAMAFHINPQGLNYNDGSRAQLFATQGGFYVDNFGPAATTIQLRQLVAGGKKVGERVFTAREDVQRFLKTIYLPAIQARSGLDVFFHDNHFEAGFERRVFFPPNSLSINRSIEQNNVWQLDLQMLGLEKYPYSEVQAKPVTPRPSSRKSYTVRAGDTLDKIVRKLAGRHANALRRKRIRARLLELNPQLAKRRAKPGGHGTVKPFQLAAGELILLPAT